MVIRPFVDVAEFPVLLTGKFISHENARYPFCNWDFGGGYYCNPLLSAIS
jgi:hypothetical protein